MPQHRGWRIRVPATSANLGPGFDCMGLALRRYLALTVAVTEQAGGWEIVLCGEGAARIPRDKTNLIYRSFEAVAGAEGGPIPGLRAEMTNEIPLARGLGSSAAAIAAGMAAGQLVVSGEVDRQAIIDRGAAVEGHPDNVAAAAMGSLVIARQTPDHVRVRRIATSDGAAFVWAVPEFELSTRASRAVLPPQVPMADAIHNLRATAWLAAAWAAGDWHGVAEAMEDRLHEPYRARLIPGFDEVRQAARKAGALATCLSGSGPTILALTLDGADAIARAMEAAWHKLGIRATARPIGIDTEGLVVTPLSAGN